ncbi:MAG: hypothetical protein H6Q99_2956 [Proteobacteria bacterium]|nr:hypothetical protein [Pseudomonadota bacterium]
MGCASLGSRISPAHGRRMLETAFDLGITWYDVAPSYGAGRAEDILAPFVAAHRHEIFLCSKAGLLPPRHNGLMRLAYDVGRPVVAVARGLSRRFRAIKATRNRRVPLTAELIETSISRSLARLGTDHLDVFALHDPDPADLERDEVIAALERIVLSGRARHISIAGSLEAATKAADIPVFDFFQLADDPLTSPLAALRRLVGRPAGFVTHSVFGVGGARDLMRTRLNAAPALAAEASALGYGQTPADIATTVLMRRAFASNPDGVVLASMFSGDHLAANAALAAAPIDPGAKDLADRVFSAT